MKSIVNDKDEIDFIFQQMKKYKEDIRSHSEFDIRKDRGKKKSVVIRRLDGTGTIMFQFSYYENGKFADLGNGVEFVRLSDHLVELLHERIH
ncbi:hypothetical protein EJP77_02010 [Paenibacillus zeisoli]|uniref:Uncharacterized protein n=1 Tax=Paenibacillus zeisoli TaxID=2496267 RepID=A0A3S1DDG4_9BACL|nr:hypothetical protein [Paenibacillus zeisoli]RUT35814.1 hypothetical protein EJP77_02010 [Paenibacillus zeisoli]